MYAEQQMNVFQLARELGLAVDIKLDYRKAMRNDSTKPKLVMAYDIENGIRKLMENGGKSHTKGIKQNVKEMSEKSKIAIKDGGSSYNSIARFIEDVIINVPREAVINTENVVQESEESVGKSAVNNNQPTSIEEPQVEPAKIAKDQHKENCEPVPDQLWTLLLSILSRIKRDAVETSKKLGVIHHESDKAVVNRLAQLNIEEHKNRNKVFDEAKSVKNIKTKIALWLKACYDLKEYTVEDIIRCIQGVRKLKAAKIHMFCCWFDLVVRCSAATCSGLSVDDRDSFPLIQSFHFCSCLNIQMFHAVDG
ncbi:hypothetical protein RHSIM_Rhsim04G0083500 [Rhododendron simsii]|uniref:Uncharacterized protein n=1 Tax=Rhododendron simsii TaxID=118357 RepID=A0A834H084_RHOSS|nr:hypothetical protein RHSIM_Rhsim04G0083500 [Rhododendron simsii]